MGYFNYFPLWELEEPLAFRTFINPSLTDKLGAFLDKNLRVSKTCKDAIRLQHRAVAMLTTDQVMSIARNEIRLLDDKSPSQPKSAIMGYGIATDDDFTFKKRVGVLVSPLVTEKIYSSYMNELWQTMLFAWDQRVLEMFEFELSVVGMEDRMLSIKQFAEVAQCSQGLHNFLHNLCCNVQQ